MRSPMSTARDLSYTVAVRTLCEFTARRGDLDLRFSPSPSAQEGVAGHQLVAARRPPGYRTEISLSGTLTPFGRPVVPDEYSMSWPAI